ncbi:MAG TPA: Asp-tRNA(Asn)/Glu-tRNA(Gln) amidotransferase subunit GatB [Gemmatimonadota bacterium]|jgi:aspartyl-tRNA(Asn)/glutamyl-tRNA(Gln) amidotransferase subunit B
MSHDLPRPEPALADFEPVIGLEVHVQLKTESKIFCACSTGFGAPPNTQVCPVCMGFPGSLPVLNGRAVEYAVAAALALNCTVNTRSIFARKNYFYPDLPKGYQISQFDQPLATEGWIDLAPRPRGTLGGERGPQAEPATDGGTPPSTNGVRRVRIVRLHLEEDAGKSFHGAGDDVATLLDFNRCGVPLIEIVSAPDLAAPGEAYLYLTRLKQLLHYLDVSDVNMEEGSLRCDANVSVRPAGARELGTKTEIKNLNSFKNVEHALEFEITRQVEELRRGGRVEHQTLLWDAARGEARPMRSKEMSHDYRYFPEPDLGALVLDPAEVDAWRHALPELPDAKQERLQARYGIPAYDAGVLAATRPLADWFERAVALHPHAPKEVSNWVMGEVLRVLNERQIEIDRLALEPEQLAELLALKESGEVSGRTAKSIFEKMLESGKGPRQILEEENLGQISDDTELRALAAAVLEERPTEVAGFLAGRKQLLSFFIGEVMKKTRGRANPQAAGELLRQLLEAHREPLEGAPVEGAPIDVASSPPAPAAAEDVGEPPPVPDAAGGVGEPPPAPDVVEDTGAATPEPAAAAPDAPAERPAVPDVKYLPRPKPPDEPDAEPPTDPGGEWRP